MPMMGNTICTRKPLLQKPWWCPGRPFIQLEITGNSDVGLPRKKSTAMVCGESRVGTSLGFFHNFPTTTISFCLLLNVTGCYWLLVTVKALGYTPMISPASPISLFMAFLGFTGANPTVCQWGPWCPCVRLPGWNWRRHGWHGWHLALDSSGQGTWRSWGCGLEKNDCNDPLSHGIYLSTFTVYTYEL